MAIPSFLLGAAAGAAAAWFLDPNDGARRRRLAQDKALKYARKGASEAGAQAKYAAGAAKGAATQAAPVGGREDAGERLNDPALAAKVQSEIFRDPDAPKGEVSVNVEDGIVYLRGEVDSPETITQLEQAAREVEGVRGVQNLLHGPGEPAQAK
ncbi:MAG TPA: BON domain-containing protein [Thermoleophilaceae bacterium]|nr:BON domain-containing protein [Thermoleophilaceae bacterium]